MGNYAIKGRLIDGISDNAVEKGLVVVEEDKIKYAGSADNYAPAADTELINIQSGTILPGLIDCHTHVSGNDGGSFGTLSRFDSILTAASQLGLLLDAGFTFIRDMTPFSSALSRAVLRGDVKGPDIMSGGQVLSPSAGHADYMTAIPIEALKSIGIGDSLVDGVDECLKMVRKQFREGAEFIKICATGGVSSAVDELQGVQFSPEEITTMVEEAARHGTYVAAHCSSLAGTYQALKCGVMCIEHGIELDDRCIKLMSDNNVPVITTAYVLHLVTTLKDYPEYMIRKGKQAAKTHFESMRKAREAGITIAYGTDFSNSKNTPYLKNGLEFGAIVNYGFSPMEAIKIGTINGAQVCKRKHLIGSLEAGKQADVIVVEGNPLDDVGVLTDAKNIIMVMKKGVILKRNTGTDF